MRIDYYESIRANKRLTYWGLGGVVVLAFLLFGTPIGAIISGYVSNGLNSVGVKNPQTTTQTQVQLGGACSASNAWSVQQVPKAYGSDTLEGTAAENAYNFANGVGVPDLTGTTSFTSTSTYPLSSTYLIQATETSTVYTYPVNYLLGSSGTVPASGAVLATIGPSLTTASLACTPSSSNPNAYIWTVITTPVQAPDTATSDTASAIMVCTASNGGNLDALTSTFPAGSDGAQVAITCTLEIEEAYAGAGYSDCIYGTQANPVTNYASGAVYSNPSQGCVNFGMVAYLVDNATVATGESVSLDANNNAGLSLTQITNNLITSATQGYLISGFTGCNVAPGSASSTSYYPCISFTLDVSSTGDTDSGHVSNVFGLVDGQNVPYVLSHFGTGAVTAFTGDAEGADAGLDAAEEGLTANSLTPTTNNDAGAFGPLVNQDFVAITAQ